MRDFSEQLPPFYTQTRPAAELQRVLTEMAARAERDRDFTLEQLFPSTVSGWGLELWERAWGIPVDRSRSDQQRRDRIRAKIKGQGMTTVAKIAAVAGAFGESPVEVVEHFADYFFEVWFTDTVGPLADEAGLTAIINELKPAHLDWAIRYRKVQERPIYVVALPRQGDTVIWRVDCT